MRAIDILNFEDEKKKVKRIPIDDDVRAKLVVYAKDFKKSWVLLGQFLHAVYEDKLYHSWGFEKFEDYVEKELGLNKNVCQKFLKTYIFLENEEPNYFEDKYAEERPAVQVPGVDELNVLRLAKRNKEVSDADFNRLKKAVFEKGKMAGGVRQELTSLIKERKEIDPEEQREKVKQDSIRRVLSSLKTFTKDMATTKLVPYNIIEAAEEFIEKLEAIEN